MIITEVNVSFMNQAACKGQDTTLFFPQNVKMREDQKKVVAAKLICSGCAVVSNCLEYSLVHEPLGVWGGQDERERFYTRRERGIKVQTFERDLLPGVRTSYLRGMSGKPESR